MNVYECLVGPGPTGLQMSVSDSCGKSRPLPAAVGVMRIVESHPPTSLPADQRMAIDILMDYTGDECLAMAYYAPFAQDLLRGMPKDAWVLFGDEIDSWLKERRTPNGPSVRKFL